MKKLIMNTFLLLWDPSVSSYTVEDYLQDFQLGYIEKGAPCKEIAYFDDMDTPALFPDDFQWSVHDWDKMEGDDLFYMLKVGENGPNGIIMAGTFCSLPYRNEDWSGKDRVVYYADLDVHTAIHPQSAKMLPVELLEEHIPQFDWRGGHSGQLLDSDVAETLGTLWNSHLYQYLSLPRKALIIAEKAHEGQKDKAGKNYFGHPLRVSDRFYKEEERCVAMLHDVVEDTDVTLEQLREEGFGDVVIEAIDAITRREGEEYGQFIERVKENPIALRVKIEDLKDNLNVLRLPVLQEEDLCRIVKYHKALRYLEQFVPRKEEPDLSDFLYS